MAAKPSRSHWPTVSPRDKMCPTLTCTWSHAERGTGSGGERPVNSRIERRWTPSPLNSGLLWASLNGSAEQDAFCKTTRTRRRRRTRRRLLSSFELRRRVVPVRVVRQVEDLGAELQRVAVADQEVLEERDVPLVLVRAVHAVALGVAERAGRR